MEVRIGIIQAPRELDIDLPDEVSQADLIAQVEAVLGKDEGVLWLTDRRGRRVGVPASRLAYVEIGTADQARRVGYGAA